MLYAKACVPGEGLGPSLTTSKLTGISGQMGNHHHNREAHLRSVSPFIFPLSRPLFSFYFSKYISKGKLRVTTRNGKPVSLAINRRKLKNEEMRAKLRHSLLRDTLGRFQTPNFQYPKDVKGREAPDQEDRHVCSQGRKGRRDPHTIPVPKRGSAHSRSSIMCPAWVISSYCNMCGDCLHQPESSQGP